MDVLTNPFVRLWNWIDQTGATNPPGVVKPFERRHRQTPALVTGSAALAGRTGVVTEAVGEHGGRVKLGGESWAARPLAYGTTMPWVPVSRTRLM